MTSDGSYRITVQQGPNPGKVYILTKDVVTIGRDVSNDIVFNDAEASRHHSRLAWQGQGYAIEDLGSTNGTFVNGVRLSAQRILIQGDVISLGETVHLAYEAAYEDVDSTVVAGDVDAAAPVADAPPPSVAQPAIAPVEPAEPQTATGGNTRKIAIAVGCLTVLCCVAIVAVGVWAWDVPCDTWIDLYEAIGLTSTCI